MKSLIYALLLLCLSARRLSQSLPVIEASEPISISAVALAAPPAATAAAIVIRDEAAAQPTKQAVDFAPKKSGRQRKRPQSIHFIRIAKVRQVKWPTTRVADTAATGEPGPTSTRSLILAGAGAIILIISLLVAQNVTSFEGAIIVGSAVGIGAALIVVGLLLGLFSYLMGLYEKGRVARAAKPKR